MKSILRWMTAAALLAAAGATLAAPRDGLAVHLSVPQPVLSGDVDVVVNVSVTNTTRAPISVLRWELPSARPDGASFRITRDGVPVTYTGRLVKRGAPTADDVVRIEAGATLNYAVELTASYDLSRSGSYAIQYVSKGSRDANGAAALRSDAAYVWLESRSGRGAVPAPSVSGPQTPDAITFTGNCSASRQTQLTDAVAAALNYANGSVAYYDSTRSGTGRYQKWFGVPTRTNYATARTHYVAIQDAFATKPLTLDCSCTDSYYAYVYSNQPYKIYLCNAFWSAPMTGTDSKAGTLIHEMSHFSVVAGTADWAYGQSAAASLAISDPDKALNNADSHEYFSENTPAIP